MNSLPAWQIAGYIALHFGAIACALGTRVAAGTRYEVALQFLFLPTLGAIGLSTWYCQSESLGIGIPSGVTFILMVLLAVTDLRRTHDPSAAHHFGAHR